MVLLPDAESSRQYFKSTSLLYKTGLQLFKRSFVTRPFNNQLIKTPRFRELVDERLDL